MNASLITQLSSGCILAAIVAFSIFSIAVMKKKQCSLQMPLSSKILLILAELPGLVALVSFLMEYFHQRETRNIESIVLFISSLIIIPGSLIFALHAWLSIHTGEGRISGLAGFLWTFAVLFVSALAIFGILALLMFGAITSEPSLLS